MGHFVVLIIIPQEVHSKGHEAIIDHIEEKMEPFEENQTVKPYVVMTRSEFNEKFLTALKTNSELTFDTYAEDCGYSFNSNGDLTSTRNPQPVYDWYTIGGRSEGILTGKRNPSISAFGFHSESQALPSNMISMKSFSDEYQRTGEAYGFIIDGTGQLHHRRSLSTWGEIKTESEWKVIYDEILEINKEGYIVNIDCHC
jgi:hypothetical protein